MEYWESLLDCHLFQGMAYEDIEYFLTKKGAQWLKFNRGDTLFPRGEFVDSVLIVLEGNLKVSEILKAGADNVVEILGSGETFGLAMAITKSHPNILIEATKKGSALVIKWDDATQRANQLSLVEGQVICNALVELAVTVQEHAAKLTYLRYSSLRATLSAYLIHRSNHQEGVPFVIPMNKTILADYLSVSRAAMVKTLSAMRAEGVIDFHKNEYEILDIENLKSHIAR